VLCGYNHCHAALDFHHPDALTKDFNVSSRTAWTPALKRELDKVVLLCARCHREVHDGLHPSLLELH